MAQAGAGKRLTPRGNDPPPAVNSGALTHVKQAGALLSIVRLLQRFTWESTQHA